jgi:hypothetical protein
VRRRNINSCQAVCSSTSSWPLRRATTGVDRFIDVSCQVTTQAINNTQLTANPELNAALQLQFAPKAGVKRAVKPTGCRHGCGGVNAWNRDRDEHCSTARPNASTRQGRRRWRARQARWSRNFGRGAPCARRGGSDCSSTPRPAAVAGSGGRRQLRCRITAPWQVLSVAMATGFLVWGLKLTLSYMDPYREQRREVGRHGCWAPVPSRQQQSCGRHTHPTRHPEHALWMAARAAPGRMQSMICRIAAAHTTILDMLAHAPADMFAVCPPCMLSCCIPQAKRQASLLRARLGRSIELNEFELVRQQ